MTNKNLLNIKEEKLEDQPKESVLFNNQSIHKTIKIYAKVIAIKSKGSIMM